MDGFKRPRPSRSVSASRPTPAKKPQVAPMVDETLDVKSTTASLVQIDEGVPKAKKTKKRWPKVVLIVLVSILLVLGLAVGAGYFWYKEQLKPLNPDDNANQKVVINASTSYGFVATRLKERGLIRSELAFNVYGLISGKNSQLKEGTCSLNPSESVQEIVDKLTSGCHDFKSITFYPGATIEKPVYKPEGAVLDQSMNIKSVLASAGYSEAEIKAALAKSYSSPLFADKPTGTTLEGYIYGETYYVDTDATVESVFETSFAEMYKDIEPLIPGFKKQGLNLYQAITLASVVQRELNCEGKPEENGRKQRCHQYQREIAQVFLKRLKEGVSLGSDVTFIYAADQLGVFPSVDLDSPYNTRVHTGLPPGPIASPGLLALKAVADPADTDYLFFLAGDDGLIYFGKTQAEHEKNIVDHCQKGCAL